MLSDTYEDEKEPVPLLDIKALRIIGSIVRAAKSRISAAVCDRQLDVGRGDRKPGCTEAICQTGGKGDEEQGKKLW